MSSIEKRKVVVIGLDGATLDVIRPLVGKGRLPNLAKIMKEGAHGELRSTTHPITPQAWTSFLTGKHAGKHGILDFSRRKRDSYEIELINASARKAESIFSILSREGKTVGAVLNVALCVLFVPYWGIVGAAAAESISSLFWNVFLVSKVLQRMNIHPTVLGRIRIG